MRVRAQAKDGRYRYSAKTDADGRTTLGRLRPIEYSLVALGKGIAITWLGNLIVSAAGADPIEYVVPTSGEFVVNGRPGETVEIRRVAPPPYDRVLVTGLTKRWISYGTMPEKLWNEVEHKIGADGTLTVGPLSPGDYRVTIGGATKRITVHSGGHSSSK